jgi:hypothetical protein
MGRSNLKAVEDDYSAQRAALNADRERAQFLAASIFPGDGFKPSDDDDIAGMLFELLSIFVKYDDIADREYLIFGIGEAIYPTTFEGQTVIDAYIARCASPKAARDRRGGAR